MEKKIVTQKDWVRSVLKEQGYITRNHALRNYVSRLGALIHTLKHVEGMNIITERVPVTTPWGKKGWDYKYILEEV